MTATAEKRPLGPQGKARARRGRGAPAGTAPGARPHRRGSTFGARVRYRFDNTLARGPVVVIVYLGLLSAAVVLVGAVLATAASMSFGGGRGGGFAEGVWQTLLRTLDSGSFAADVAWPTRILGLVVTLLGIFLAGSLIGLIANAVDQRVEALRRGRNAVVEAGHTLILGWSPQVPRIVAELVVANESERRACVVVLAPVDAVAMDEQIRSRVGDLRTTRLVCRNGETAVLADLERVAVRDARSIVVVRGDDGDAGVVKAVLAVRALDPDHAGAHVVAEVAEADHARTLRSVSGGRVLTVSSDDVVAEVTAQACLRSGLAAVFTELLDFDGDELYFSDVPPELAGRSYADALLAFAACSVVGVAGPGGVELNPPPERPVRQGEQVIVVAEDDTAVHCTGLPTVDVPPRPEGEATPPGPVHIAMVGWSEFGAKVLRELDGFLVPGSRVDVVVDADLVEPQSLDGLALTNAEVSVRAGDGGPDHLLELAADAPDQVIVLGYRDVLGVDDADARTLLTLLTLRQAWPAGTSDVRIVAELLDQRNLALAAPTGVDDLIVSDALASLLITQLAEHAGLQAVFDDLFDPDGAVVDLLPATAIVPAVPLPWGAVVAATSAQGGSAFGYRVGRTGEVVVNPAKGSVVTLGDGDEVVAITTRAPAPATPTAA
ncbi:MAG: hypothetical protein HYX34_07635 [Actinobacteria bacterium]|nr:hypothetical protein [Actinomycetota bacterium]